MVVVVVCWLQNNTRASSDDDSWMEMIFTSKGGGLRQGTVPRSDLALAEEKLCGKAQGKAKAKAKQKGLVQTKLNFNGQA